MTPSVKFKVNGLFPPSLFRFHAVPLGHGDKVTFPLCKRRNRRIYESIKFLNRKFENFLLMENVCLNFISGSHGGDYEELYLFGI
jgi:hypothetical protein